MTPRAGVQAGGTRDVESVRSPQARTNRSAATGQPNPRPVTMAVEGSIDPLSQFPSEAAAAGLPELAASIRARVVMTPGLSSSDLDALQEDAIAAIERFDDIAGQMAAWLDQASKVRDQLQRHLVRQDASSQALRASSVRGPAKRTVHLGVASVTSASTSMTVAVVAHRMVDRRADAMQAASKMMQLGSRLALGSMHVLSHWSVRALAPQELPRKIRPWRSGWKRINPSTRVVGGVALLALLSLRAAGSSNPPAPDAIAAPVEFAEPGPILAPPPQPAVVAGPATRLIEVSTEAPSTAPSKPPLKALSTARSAALSTAPPQVQMAPSPEPARPREYFGTLAVMSDPIGARVLIDGKYVGETPIEVPRLRAGSHVVWIEAAGFVRWTGALSVPADRRTAIQPKLLPEPDR
jgi:hypothetical protein